MESKSDQSNKLKCPKCGSNEDILLGDGDKPNHCSECDHEWQQQRAAVITQQESFQQTLAVKSPAILMTINRDLRKKRSIFSGRLDEALSNL